MLHNLLQKAAAYTAFLRVELRANLKSISHRYHLFKAAFVWKLTKETVHLPLGG